MSITKIILFFKVQWLKTIVFNFYYLPIWQAIHLPFFIYKGCKCFSFSHNGKIILDVLPHQLCTGMIKLGIKHEATCISKQGVVLQNSGTIIFKGCGVIGNGTIFSIKKNATLSIGENFGITGNLKLHCHNSINIGNHFSCSWNVSISDTDFHPTVNLITGKQNPLTAPIIINNGVWICPNTTIQKGSILPPFCIVASNSLVNKQYELQDFSVIGGIPAKPLNIEIRNEDIWNNYQNKNFKITRGLSIFSV